ncbi:hypothetical protein KAR52_02585 [Candidatus Pacearchaeota archaeon]|nr:hypothetical protein [Candidatus Pacearchaeota archaeon]
MEPEKESNMKKKENFVKKCKKNPWVLSTFILGILTLILLANIFSGSITGKVISGKDAGEMLLDFYKTSGVEKLTLDSVDTEGDFYKIILIYQEKKIPFYVTKTGYMVGNDLVSVIKEKPSSVSQPPESTSYSEGDLNKLRIFSSCLAEKGLVIYGANWCGWTTKLAVDTLGGFEIAGNAYVECTENTELCASEGIEGYPTIKLNGKVYSDGRTLEALGEATGCAVPDLSIKSGDSNSDVQC